MSQDLVVLVPDKNMESAVTQLLQRPEALGIRAITFDIFVHIGRDPGCYGKAHDFLRPFVGQYQYSLVMFDHHGSGREGVEVRELEAEVRRRLEQNGWPHRAAVVVLAPELEVWVWSDSPEVERCLGWSGQTPSLRDWLRERDLWSSDDPKPSDPKVAVEEALRAVRRPRSSAIYAELARRVSVKRCVDPGFQHFRQTLIGWFGR